MAHQNEPMVELSTSRDSLPVKLTHEEREERLTQAFAQIKRSGGAPVLGTRQPNDLDKERIAAKRQRSLPGMTEPKERSKGKKGAEEVTGVIH